MNKSNRKRKRTRKTRKRISKRSKIGGVKVYTMEGDFTSDPKILHEGKDFFRKMTTNETEKEICKLLMKNPHKNIITIYGVGEDYIDMELLSIDMSKENIEHIKDVTMEVKTHLQKLGVMYIDWKLDNMGISKDGEIKLFDFDVSGLVDTTTGQFILDPPKYWAYRNAVQHGMTESIDIDNYAFENGIK